MVKTPIRILNELWSKVGRVVVSSDVEVISRHGESPRDWMSEDSGELTQKTTALRKRAVTLSPQDIDLCVLRLEPQFYQHFLPTFKNKQVLYVATPDLPYASALVRTSDVTLVCMAPEFNVEAPLKGGSVQWVQNHYSDPCFRPACFDVLILPETSCKAIHFLPRIHYWSSLLRPGGEVYLTLPHSGVRFFFSTRELRHKHSRTATFERVVERVRAVGLSLLAAQELQVLHVPATLFKGNATWDWFRREYEELPILLGLHLKKE